MQEFIFETTKPTDSEVKKLLIKARSSPKKKDRDEAKMKIFLSHGYIIKTRPSRWRAMLKYQGIKKDWIYEDQEIYLECWEATQNAINNFGRLNKIKGRRAGEFDDYNIEYDYKVNGFGSYLKKVLDRNLYRLFEKRFKKGETEDIWFPDGKTSLTQALSTLEASDDPSEIMPDISEYGFTEDEAMLFQSRIDGITLSKYMEMYGTSQDEYYRMLDSIKKKVKKGLGHEL